MHTLPPTHPLRRARPADAEAIAAIMGEPNVYAGLLQMPYADVDAWRKRIAELSEPGKQDLLLVAEAEGQVVGSAGLHPSGPMFRRRHAFHLGISVATAWQGRGVGSSLMAGLCSYADDWVGALRLELTVFVDNARAIALYERFGFQIEGTHLAYALRGGQLVDAHCMARLHPRPPALPSS